MADLYCYSMDEETFFGAYATREEAIGEAVYEAEKRNERGTANINKIYTGKNEPKTILDYFDGDDFAVNIEERAYEDVGDSAEGWLTDMRGCLTPNQKEDLEKVINEWADRHNLQPSFYGVCEIEEHLLTEPK